MKNYRKPYYVRIGESYISENATEKDKYKALKEYPEYMNIAIQEQDYLVYLMKCIECQDTNNSLLEQAVMESLPEKIPYVNKRKEWLVPSITPICAYKEDVNIHDNIFTYIYRKDTKEYYHTLQGLLEEYSKNPTKETAQKIAEMGWFITSDDRIDGKKIALGKTIQKCYMNQFSFNEIKLDEFTTDINPTTIDEEKEYIAPIFLFTCHNAEGMINRMGIVLDNFDKIYHIMDQTEVETNPIMIDTYTEFTGHGYRIEIRCFFVDSHLKDDLKNKMNFIANINYEFDYKNLFKFATTNLSTEMNTRLAVAQLIQLCVNLINSAIGEFTVSNNPNRPKYRMNYPNVFLLYKGAYDDLASDKVFEKALALKNYMGYTTKEQVSVSEAVDKIFDYKIENFNIKTNNDKVNDYLFIIQEMLTPTSSGIDNVVRNARLEVPENIKEEYEKSYELLSSYGFEDIQGMKHELARLFYLNSILEMQIKNNPDKDTPEYIDLLNLRTNIITTFHTYFKVVKQKEPEFSFMNYMMNSEYKDKVITINKKDFKYDGKHIKEYIDLMKVK